MKDFRAALDRLIAGELEPALAQQQLAAAARAAPQLSSAMLATLEAYERTGRVSPQLAAMLRTLVQANASAAAPPPPAPPAAADRTQFRPAGGADRTQFRPAGASAATPVPPAPTPPAPTPPPPSPPAGDRTQFRPQGAPQGTPVAAPAAGQQDKTQFRPRAAPAGAVPPGEPVDPLSALGAGPQTARSVTGATGATSGTAASWTDFNRLAGTPAQQLSLGSVLKGRFVLESIVAGGDKGGMGVVYKARDLIKEEAQDRHPYVAIKVLNEDFKRHPDSMKALQRESRKAQTLSHPNIINVHDFDRDGGNVFMAMELLEGSPLNDVIRTAREKGGLPPREALRVIDSLGRALGHAHAKGIVHSDFKPSNAFLTHEGTVKVLDFGIARAAKIGGAGAGDKTLFDAGTLGALTMPYASCEQIEGKDPDPSDDVYALAVVSYELLTGRHPFERTHPDKTGQIERTDAVSARAARLKPAPVGGLSRSQWRTLQSGLAFERGDRPRNALAFVEGLAPRRLPLGTLIGVGAAIVLLLVLAVVVVPSYLQRSRLAALSGRLQSSDPATVAAALRSLRSFSPDARASVLVNDAVQSALFAYFNQRSHAAFDPASGHYDYRGALAGLKEAQGLSKVYEDSRQLTDYVDQLESARKAEILRQAERFEARLKDGVLIGAQGADNAQAALDIIAQLDPAHPLLNDRRLPIAFAAQTRAALDGGNVTLAAQLLAAGLRLAPQDVNLRDLQDRVDRQRSSAQLAAQIGQLEGQVARLGTPAATLQDFRTGRDALEQLRRAAPTSRTFAAAQGQLGNLVGALVAGGVAQRQVADAQAVVGEFADLLPAPFVATQRTAIARVMGEAQARDAEAQQLRAALGRLAASPQSTDAWVAEAKRDLDSLESLVGKNDTAARDARARASQAFLAQAQGLLADRRLTEAQRVLDLGRDFGLTPEQYGTLAGALAQARTALESENREREASAQIAAGKQRVLDQALADRIDAAEAQLADLQKKLPATDVFVTTDAPRAIGTAYLARAMRFAGQQRFDDALQSAAAAARAAPREAQFQSALQRLQIARELAASLASATDFAPLKAQFDRLRSGERADYAPLDAALGRALIERLNRVGARDAASAMQLRASAAPLFPGLALPSFREQPAAPVRTASAPPPLVASPPPAPAAVTPVPAPAAPETAPVAPAAGAPGASATQQASAAPTTVAVAGTTLRPCTASLAGLGQNPRASCRDALSGGGRGPELVVIPAGDGLGMFAIMRDEATVAEYAAYCNATGCAAPVGATPEIPITSVSVLDAEKFAAWLSAQTGMEYRLPTEQEWHHAAGSAPDPKANCLVTVNGQIIRGSSLRPADVGDLNALGLRHVVGNAQEWAKGSTGGWKALGGAIGDALDLCSPQLSRPHTGTPDGRTGFRLVREMR
jgi:serine/threonine protein kinase/formylglycine-generating enzyme required for sulfatase activity